MERIRNSLKDESGASLVEYGLLVALIAIACIVALSMLGINLATIFTTAANAFASAS